MAQYSFRICVRSNNRRAPRVQSPASFRRASLPEDFQPPKSFRGGCWPVTSVTTARESVPFSKKSEAHGKAQGSDWWWRQLQGSDDSPVEVEKTWERTYQIAAPATASGATTAASERRIQTGQESNLLAACDLLGFAHVPIFVGNSTLKLVFQHAADSPQRNLPWNSERSFSSVLLYVHRIHIPTLLRADARRIPLADASVQCAVTSPPYWGLRKYDGAQDGVWGGGSVCKHQWGEEKDGQAVQFDVTKGPKGWQAENVQAV